ncbi:MAG: hypothetical protein JTT11_07670 [Candidatus Brockarchaeota archaeon]|nr:hypothetical protein [Candidatus Brockarchaeota archaeon]
MLGGTFRLSRKRKAGGGAPSLVDFMCSKIRDGRWHSCEELANSFSLPPGFVREVCIFLQRYGFADFRGEWVRLDPDQPTLHEAAKFLRCLARRSITIPIWEQFYVAPGSYSLSFS